jgi:hypothetical protein
MKVGDLVRRKNISPWRKKTSSRRELGLVLSIQEAGWSAHVCLTVFYPESGKTYDIAQSLVEVLNESR